MGYKTKKIILKMNGKHLKGMYVERSKKCMVLEIPGTSIHSTFPLVSKDYHWTPVVELSEEEAEIVGKCLKQDKNFRYTLKDGKLRIYPKISTDNFDVFGVHLGTFAGFMKECSTLKKDYEIIDLDALGCKIPNIWVTIRPQTEKKLYMPDMPYILKTLRIDYPDVIVILEFIDATKHAECVKQSDNSSFGKTKLIEKTEKYYGDVSR
ncbi:MAG: hypothetical protein HY516_02070 [Candidatus Aenigmarchaeota archaeon]|nr:hypothetical protein [Candidatus Aenigmarchaeota archaeon]